MHEGFGIRQSLRFGWDTLRAHNVLVFQVVLTLLALQVASSIVGKVLEGTALGALASLALLIIESFTGVGATVITLKLAKGERALYADLLPAWGLVWRCIVAGICVWLGMMLPLIAGFLLLAVFFTAWPLTANGSVIHISALMHSAPVVVFSAVVAIVAVVLAIHVGLRLSMARYEIIEGRHIWESLERSYALTHGSTLTLFLLILVLVLVNIVGAMVLLVGLLVSLPVSAFAFAYAYLRLRESFEKQQQK